MPLQERIKSATRHYTTVLAIVFIIFPTELRDVNNLSKQVKEQYLQLGDDELATARNA
jgi:hypothetical protein